MIANTTMIFASRTSFVNSACMVIAFILSASYLCSAQTNLWPLPQNISSTSNTLQLIPKQFNFIVKGQSCDVLKSGFSRWWHRTFPVSWSRERRSDPGYDSNAVLHALAVNVITPCSGIFPSLESDESYLLEISSKASILTASTVWGALHGLETFSQLVYKAKNGMYVVNETSIVDFPRFKHRGLLLDTSRHFLSKEMILHNLDIMAQNKLNVFHWHIVDDPSFPYQSITFPELSDKGAFHPVTHVYTQNDIREIIEVGRLLGIRVMPEFDSPGHTQSWGASHKELLTPCYHGAQPNGNYGPVNPVPEYNYKFIKTFFKEVASVFPDKFIHAGGDEVNMSCWKSNPNVTAFMKKMGFGRNYNKLEQYYMQRILDDIGELGKHYLIWQEVIDNKAKVQNDTVVHVWKQGYKKELAKVTSLGYKTLLSSCWYLNYISYGSDWQKYYLCDPQDFKGSDKQKELVIGGEACMWGEYVDDTNLMPRLWPRAAVVAERLWSAKNVNDLNAAKIRLMHHRCRLVRRGVAAEPISGPGFCPKEF